MSDNRDKVLPCTPASTRRSQVSGPVSEKLVTEDCKGVGTQAPLSVNTTGLKGNTKKLLQQTSYPHPASAEPGDVNLLDEDCIEVSSQVFVAMKDTSEENLLAQPPIPAEATKPDKAPPNKKLVQQAFHPSMFIRPRSASLGNIGAPSSTQYLQEMKQPLDMNTGTISPDNTEIDTRKTKCPPSWQRLPTTRNPKRKKVSDSPPRMVASPTEAVVNTSNRFSGLPIDLTEESTETISTKPKHIYKPPPLILYGIKDLSKLTELLNKNIPADSYSYKILNRDQLKIMTQSAQVYKNLIELVRSYGLIGHTFTQKENKCCRVVIKKLHHTTPKEAIIEAIEKSGNKVRGEIICSLSRKDKMPLNMFFVNLEPSPNNAAVKSIQFIYHTRVHIEDPRRFNDIPQCARCQQYGHTKNNCMRPFRCVKCAEGHRTTDCPKKDRNTPATCALCHGEHPANYKGCRVYKEIYSRKIANNTNKKSTVLHKDDKQTLEHSSETSTIQKPPHLNDFPLLKPSKHPRPKYAETKPENVEQRSQMPNYWYSRQREKSTENAYSQPTNLLEQVIIKQSEKIDVLIQQISTLMGLLTTVIARCNK